MIHRRTLLKGLIAAPAIIAIERLMKPKLWKPEPPKVVFTGLSDSLIKAAQVSPSVAYLYSGHGYYKSNDGGATWTRLPYGAMTATT